MIYKKDPNEYPDWNKYNPPGGYGQFGRFYSDYLTCTNPECPRYQKFISEKEAFYLFARLGFFSRIKSIKLPTGQTSLYVCPFCERRDSLIPADSNLKTL